MFFLWTISYCVGIGMVQISSALVVEYSEASDSFMKFVGSPPPIISIAAS